MTSLLAASYLKLKLDVSLEEAERLNAYILDLRCHGLEECPELSVRLSSKYLKTIQCLLLQINKLSTLNKNVCQGLIHLKALSLDYNRLTDLPYDFRKLGYLTMLNVSHNPFSDAHFFYVICQLKTLRILWANATGLRRIPKEIQNLKKLRILGLRKNRLKILPMELFSLQELQWLTLSSNEIMDVPDDITKLKALVHLNLQHNCLERLPANLSDLKELQYLLLQYNDLTINDELVSFIRTFPKLKRCWLTGNLPDPTEPDTTPVQQIFRHDDTASANMASSESVSSGSQQGEIFPQDIVSIVSSLDEYSLESLTAGEISEQQELHGDVLSLSSNCMKVMQPEDVEIVYRRSTHHIGENSLLPMDGCGAGLLEKDHEIRVSGEDQSRSLTKSTCMSNVEQHDDAEQQLGCSLHSLQHPSLAVDEPEDSQTEELSIERRSHCGSGFCTPSPHKLAAAVRGNCSQGNEINPGHDIHASKSASKRRYSCDRIRMSRTREWVNCHSACQVSGIDNMTLRTTDTNSNSAEQNAYLQSLHEMVENHISELIAESVDEVRRCNEATSAESKLVFIPVSTGHPPTPDPRSSSHRLMATSSNITSDKLVCLKSPIGKNENDGQPNDVSETSSLVSASEGSLSRQNNNENWSRNGDVAQESVNVGPNASTCAQLGTINQRFTSNTTVLAAARSRLELESNYDPSDYEHSTPSSAIDDQDFATRFVDINAEDNRSELVLDDDDVLAVVPRLLMIMPPAYDIPMPIEHHPLGYLWQFCKLIVKYIRWMWPT
ncbi:unnamed protein product [Orchesella dallaii]|uniref:Disease resistance R13L4/SHOC-2-like LRR domain-containing protein n=1 Tax=Orchesella dallaii TaxID=48710 RepID=A0ABP1QD99_9HEXA